MTRKLTPEELVARKEEREKMCGEQAPKEEARKEPKEQEPIDARTDMDSAIKKAQDEKKERAVTDYQGLLNKVLEAKRMTDTVSWRRFYADLLVERKKHEIDILTTEKTRALVAHQEAIKILNGIMFWPQKSIDELNHYCASMPLFVHEFHMRAQFNTSLGSIELSESR